MTAEEYLEQYQIYKGLADRHRMEILERKKIVEDMARCTFPKKYRHVVQVNIDWMIEGIKQLKETEDQYRAKCEAIEETISKIDGIEGEVLRYRYIDGMKWDAIFDKTFYSHNGIFNVHRRGLKKLESAINDLRPQSEAHISS